MRQVRSFLGIAAAVAFVGLGACAPGKPGGGNGDDDGDDDDTPGTVDAGDPNAGFIDATPNLDGGPFVDGGGEGGACDKIDILFVVDNSNSMDSKQAALAAAFPEFMHVIETYAVPGGGHLNYHVGVTSTDHGGGVTIPQNGELLNSNVSSGMNCAFPGGRKYLQSGDANVATAFVCAAHMGTGGSGLEMPLQAAKMALVDQVQGSSPPNAGFVREDALLAIVLLTDENDCSTVADPGFFPSIDYCDDANLEPVSSYVTAFDGVKGQRGRWATAIIAIPPNSPTCGTGSSENVRLQDFAEQTGANAVFANICSAHMEQSLMSAFETFALACENIPPVN
jgi:hypothetical protein